MELGEAHLELRVVARFERLLIEIELERVDLVSAGVAEAGFRINKNFLGGVCFYFY